MHSHEYLSYLNGLNFGENKISRFLKFLNFLQNALIATVAICENMFSPIFDTIFTTGFQVKNNRSNSLEQKRNKNNDHSGLEV